MTQLLIDGDMLVYQTTVGHEFEVRWDHDLHTLHCRLDDCIETFEEMYDNFLEKFEPTHILIAFSCSGNFRKDVDPTYKSHRKGTRKPLAYKSLKEHVEKNYNCKTMKDLEADDVMGIYATSGVFKDPIIISDDKDMLTIPGQIYRLGQMYKISEDLANEYFYTQVLTGDTADGYKGCPGIGPKRAEQILGGWPEIVMAYEKAGLTEQDAIRQARLARILRAEDYQGGVVLWTPPKTEETTGTT